MTGEKLNDAYVDGFSIEVEGYFGVVTAVWPTDESYTEYGVRLRDLQGNNHLLTVKVDAR